MSRSIQPFSHRVWEQRMTSGKVWILNRSCLPLGTHSDPLRFNFHSRKFAIRFVDGIYRRCRRRYRMSIILLSRSVDRQRNTIILLFQISSLKRPWEERERERMEKKKKKNTRLKVKKDHNSVRFRGISRFRCNDPKPPTSVANFPEFHHSHLAIFQIRSHIDDRERERKERE